MRKLVALFMLAISVMLLGAAMNKSFIAKIKFEKYFDHLEPQAAKGNAFYKAFLVHSERWRYGDLYGLSYLHSYKFELEPFKKYPYNANKPTTNRLLYVIGDSFLADKTLTGAFNDFDNVIFLDRRFKFGPIKLDSSKQNYLLMEFAERNLNGYDIRKTDEILRDKENVKYDSIAKNPKQLETVSIFERVNAIIFNKDLSRNLELILFDNKFATPFKEAKAWLNYNLFGRVAKEVSVSTDKKRLLFNVTVDTASFQSAFKFKSEQAVDSIVRNLDSARDYYQAIGFKKVFLSIIPNPVSIYDSKRMIYNRLLERVEQKTDIPTVPLFNIFKYDNRNLFYRSDSHWNPLGMEIWVKETNKVLTAGLHKTQIN